MITGQIKNQIDAVWDAFLVRHWRQLQEDFDEATLDACLIAGGQRAEHYESRNIRA